MMIDPDSMTTSRGGIVEDANQALDRAIATIVACLRSGGTLYACGNGGSHAHAAHLVTELRVGMAYRHRALEAKLLCGDLAEVLACANDLGFDQVFAHPAGALRRSDVLLALSTSGQSRNVLNAVRVANERGATTVALVGPRGLGVCDETRAVDLVEVRSSSIGTAAIQEDHQRWVHEIARRVEQEMFPPMTEPMTLWSLLDGLRKCPPGGRVRLEPFGLWWDGLTSWRGIYAEPSICYRTNAHEPGKKPFTTAEVIAEVEEAASGRQTFYGWKGGEFTYSLSSPVHVDNRGDYTPSNRIVRVEVDGDYENADAIIVVEYSR